LFAHAALDDSSSQVCDPCAGTTIAVRFAMGLAEVKQALIRALTDGDYQHEARDALSEKNLLAIGEVSEKEVMQMVRRTTGGQYSTSPHVWDRDTTVHVFTPQIEGQSWYVKAYFLTWPQGPVVFISVHRRGQR